MNVTPAASIRTCHVPSLNRRVLLVLLTIALLLTVDPTPASAHEIIVYSFVTDAGKKVTAPTPDHPVNILLGSYGYQEAGAPAAGERSPPPEYVERLVRHALASSGYKDGTDHYPEEDLMVTYSWGTMNPVMVRNDGTRDVCLNEEEMLRLVGGNAPSRMWRDREAYESIREAALEPRYFVVVSGYDFAAYLKQRVKKLLWRAQMSIHSTGLTQTEAVPMLLAAGAALFGCETPIPRRITMHVSGILSPEP